MYVVELVAPDTVNTMPESTILAVADHGELRGDAVRGTYDQARKVFEDLAELGVTYEDVVTVLEEEGVTKFAASWQELLDTIQVELERQ
jgi:transaldolase